jgi:hypothetical protein
MRSTPVHVSHEVRASARAGVLAVLLAVGLFLTVFAQPPALPVQLAVVAALGVTLLPWVIGAKTEFDIFSPIYLYSVAFFVLFVLRPAVMYAFTDSSPSWLGYDISRTYSPAILLGVYGTIAVYVGFYLGPTPRERAPRLPRRLSAVRLAVATSALIVTSAVAYAYFIGSAGGAGAIALLLGGRSLAFGAVLQGANGYLYTAPLWLASAGVLLLAWVRSWLSPGGLFAIVLIVASELIPLAFGDRSWFLPAAMAVAIVFYLRRGRRPSLGLIALLIPVVFIFGITLPREYRNFQVRQAYSATDVVSTTVDDLPTATSSFLTGLDTAMLDDLAVEMATVPDPNDYQHGSTYVEALTRPVPRAIWPTKPFAAEVTLMGTLWPSLASITQFYFSMFGEPYFNGGALGVGIVGVLFGAFWRYLWLALRRQFDSPIAMALYAVSLPFIFVYMRGGVGADYQREVIFTAPILALAVLAATRGPKRTTVARSLDLKATVREP